MSKKKTKGDIFSTPCPYCGEEINYLWRHGNLYPGDKIICGHCEKQFLVVFIDTYTEVHLETIEE